MDMKLREIRLKGFKSIDGHDGQTIPIGDTTVLLGANGSGKSNIVSFFTMLNFMTTGALRQYVGRQGVSRLLFYGPKKTESITFEIQFESANVKDTYEMKLSHGLHDRLFISGEKITFQKRGEKQAQEIFLGSGGSESGLKGNENPTCKVMYALLAGIRAYQFHDTSDTAKIKDRGYINDYKYLRSDAGNLAAFLKMLKGHYTQYYERIVRHIQHVMSQFVDFDLDSLPDTENYLRLNWNDTYGTDYLFDPGQISDGSLRFIALTTLLLQPPELLPKFIVLDEPELGLHPVAITELAGMIHSASKNAQILLATQSTRLVDEFELENLLVLEWDKEKHCSVVKELNAEHLTDWLKRYSLSELWEKNVLGGQP